MNGNSRDVGEIVNSLPPSSGPSEREGPRPVPSYDHLGNVVAVVDDSGAVVAAYEYDPFGNIVAQSGPEADEVPFRFSTKYFDPETNLYYYGYRFYAPLLGRWINRDPIEEVGGSNIYSFCKNTPISYYDPKGLSVFGYSLIWRTPTTREQKAIDDAKRSIGAKIDRLLASIDNIYRIDTMVPSGRDALQVYGIGRDISGLDAELERVFNLSAMNWPSPRNESAMRIRSILERMRSISSFSRWVVSKRDIGVLGLTNPITRRIGLNCILFYGNTSESLQNVVAHEISHLFGITSDNYHINVLLSGKLYLNHYDPNLATNYGDLLEF